MSGKSLIVFGNHSIAPILVTLNRSRFYPFALRPESVQFLQSFIYTEEPRRKKVVFVDGIENLCELEPYFDELKKQKITVCVFDSPLVFNSISKYVHFADAKRDNKLEFDLFKLTPVEIQNLLDSFEPSYKDKSIFCVSVKKTDLSDREEIERSTFFVGKVGKKAGSELRVRDAQPKSTGVLSRFEGLLEPDVLIDILLGKRPPIKEFLKVVPRNYWLQLLKAYHFYKISGKFNKSCKVFKVNPDDLALLARGRY